MPDLLIMLLDGKKSVHKTIEIEKKTNFRAHGQKEISKEKKVTEEIESLTVDCAGITSQTTCTSSVNSPRCEWSTGTSTNKCQSSCYHYSSSKTTCLTYSYCSWAIVSFSPFVNGCLGK